MVCGNITPGPVETGTASASAPQVGEKDLFSSRSQFVGRKYLIARRWEMKDWDGACARSRPPKRSIGPLLHSPKCTIVSAIQTVAIKARRAGLIDRLSRACRPLTLEFAPHVRECAGLRHGRHGIKRSAADAAATEKAEAASEGIILHLLLLVFGVSQEECQECQKCGNCELGYYYQ